MTKQTAQLLYEVYGKSAEWKNYAGLPMPSWDELPDNIKTHWRVVEEFIMDQQWQNDMTSEGYISDVDSQ